MTRNEDLKYLHWSLPPHIARMKEGGDIEGAIRVIDAHLAAGRQPELAPRLRLERMRLERLAHDYPFTEEQAKAAIREEWPDMTDEKFQELMDGGRIDWRYINGQICCHEDLVDSLRMYPAEATGLQPEAEDHDFRDTMLSRMKAEGGLTARITVRATIKTDLPTEGKEVQAWLPIPAACPQQSEIEFLDFSPNGQIAPEDAPQRTIWWKEEGKNCFTVTYRYLHHAPYTDVSKIVADPVQPTFCTEEELPHIAFTPYLKELAARITDGITDPLAKAAAIYDYVTGFVDYRYQPDYIQLEPIADMCARELRGDCGMFAILFITLCRICGIPAQWQSALSVSPEHIGAHDWAMFYIAPHGWLWVDASFGSSARRNGETERRAHYFGNLDPCRMVANSRFFAPLTPPMTDWRHDPYDNQRGEMMVDGHGLNTKQMERTLELLGFEWV